MEIMALGIDYSTRRRLVEPIAEEAFGERLQESLHRNADEMRRLTRASRRAVVFRGEVEREKPVDLADPRAAGWTFLVNDGDPHRREMIDALRPLALHRGMARPEEPLLFRGEPQEEWQSWLMENYSSLDAKQAPHYILVVGSPDQVPFRFQSLLDSAASVGRVDFDSPDDLAAYVEKLIRLERATEPACGREVVCFAPDEGFPGPTYYSRRYMAAPLTEHVRTRCGMPTRALLGDEATKARLAETLRGCKPALVYTASHGLGAPSETLEVQKRLNGALCCQPAGGEAFEATLFAAEDVPRDEPFLEGAVFFQFACYGYGTPAESDFMHWLGAPELNGQADFVAALPKRLLAHPRGPVSYVGHVDTAWLHGFNDPDSPDLLERWSPRIAPFVKATEMLLKVEPVGLAMAEMNKRYDISNAQLTDTIDRLQRGKITVTPEFQARLANAFIFRTDAQNYMIFGDPAARLRIPQ